MEQILDFITKFGLPVLIIACCVIAIIGVLKLLKVFEKIQSKNLKKFIYYILNVVLSFVGAAIYFKCFGISFAGYLTFCITQTGVTTTLYAFYENFGVRKLAQLVVAAIATWVKRNPEAKFTKAAEKLGFDSDKINAMLSEKPIEAPAEVKTNTEQKQ